MVKKKKIKKKVNYIKKIIKEYKITFIGEDLDGKRKEAQKIRKRAMIGDSLVFFLSKRTGRGNLSKKKE